MPHLVHADVVGPPTPPANLQTAKWPVPLQAYTLAAPSATLAKGSAMVKVSVLYPNRKNTRFDIEYYCKRHMPLVQRLVGAALKGVSVEHGICGQAPGTPAPYVALGHLLFDSVEAFQASFGPHAQEIMADIPKYTNAEPTIQISEVKL